MVKAIRKISLPGVSTHVLVVDDGSRDKTAAAAQAAGAIVVSHPTNYGVGAGFRTGLKWALKEGCNYLIHLDADGQIPPQQIPLLFAPVLKGQADVCLSSRFIESHPKNLACWKAFLLRIMAQSVGFLTGYQLTDLSCGFRCFNRKTMEVLNPHFDYDYIQETLIQSLANNAKVMEAPVTVHYDARPSGSQMSHRVFKYSFRFMMLLAYSLMDFYFLRMKNYFRQHDLIPMSALQSKIG